LFLTFCHCALSEKISCYVCDYSWVVADVNGQKVTTPVRGDSSCRDGEPSNWPIQEIDRYVDYGNGIMAERKCAVVMANGTETLYYNNGLEFKVEFDIFDRKIFETYNSTKLYGYVGNITIEEKAFVCGANSTQCSGNINIRSIKEQKQLKHDERSAACPRCNHVRGNGTYIIGDDSCEQGNPGPPSYPDAENLTCVFDPEPPINPMLGGHKRTKRSLLGESFGSDDATMSGECIIWQEIYYLNSADSDVPEQVQDNLYRTCNSYQAMPDNFYSEMDMVGDGMKLCDTDLCNDDKYTPPKPFSGQQTTVLSILMLILCATT